MFHSVGERLFLDVSVLLPGYLPHTGPGTWGRAGPGKAAAGGSLQVPQPA